MEPKKLWNEINNIVGKQQKKRNPEEITDRDGSKICGPQVEEYVNQYFASVAVKPDHRPRYPKINSVLTGPGPCLVHLDVIEEEISMEFSKVDPTKPAGPDGIPPKVLLDMRLFLFEPITKLIRKSFRDGEFPDCLKIATVVLCRRKQRLSQ